MPSKSLIQKVIESLETGSELVLNEKEQRYKDRLIYVMGIKLKEIAITDYELYEEVSKKYDTISFFQVCKDSTIVERMIGADQNPNGDPNKTWHRYMVREMTKKAFKIAEDKKESYNMTFAANALGKHQLTDKEDVVKPAFDQIIPFTPEITSDPTILGIKPMGKKELKEKKEKLLKKYGAADLIEDAEIIKDEKNN